MSSLPKPSSLFDLWTPEHPKEAPCPVNPAFFACAIYFYKKTKPSEAWCGLVSMLEANEGGSLRVTGQPGPQNKTVSKSRNIEEIHRNQKQRKHESHLR